MTLLRNDPRDDDTAAPAEPLRVRYEDDVHGWALQQAALLRAGRLNALDLDNLADEIADVAAREYDKLESALVRVIQHLLKWDHQPERRTRSWVLSIEEHRRRVAKQLRRHPGLRGDLDEVTHDAYGSARNAALIETNLPLSSVPESTPYSWDEIMNREIEWPDE